MAKPSLVLRRDTMLEEYELLNDELEKRNEELNKKIDEQAKVIQWYEKENRHNQEIIIKDNEEIERLNSIIKEVRELINKEKFTMKQKYEMREELLEILDKGDK